jgi:hypothetical protein
MGQPKAPAGTVTTVFPAGGIIGLGKRVVLKVPVVGSVIGWVLGGNAEAKGDSGVSGAIMDVKDTSRLIKEGYQVCAEGQGHWFLGWKFRVVGLVAHASLSDHETFCIFCQRMENAETYEEWLEAASRVDELEGSNNWKAIDQSPFYDSELIRSRLQEMQRVSEFGQPFAQCHGRTCLVAADP